MKDKLKIFGLLNLGTVLIAAEVYVFNIQNGFSMGGDSGLAILIGRLFGSEIITVGVLISVMNVLLLILGFIFLGKESGIKTVYSTVLYSLTVLLLERVFPLTAPITDEAFLELVYSVLAGGVGAGILFYIGATSGGTDIIAMIIRKYTGMNAGRALFAADVLIVMSCFFVFGIKAGMFSLLGLLMKTFIVDGVIDRLMLCRSFVIITEKPREICDYIIGELGHTATAVDGEGVYTGDKKKIVMTLCRNSEAARLKKKIYETDPGAFVTVRIAGEIIGRGFSDGIYRG